MEDEIQDFGTASGEPVPYAAPRGRGRLVLAALTLGALVAAGEIVTDLRCIAFMKVQETRDLTDAESQSLDACYSWLQRLSMIGLAAYLGTIVAWCVWKYRAHRNLPALGAVNLQFTSRMAAGCYFLPILNLFRPYQAASEISWASRPNADAVVDCRRHFVKASFLLVAWWVMFFASNLASQFSGSIWRRAIESNDFEFYRAAHYISIGANVVFLIATILACTVVARIVSGQERRAIAFGLAA
jgi:hypothetical protein